jgi:cell division protein ZapB
MEKIDLQLLEARIDELIYTCNQLAKENTDLRKNQEDLRSERDVLLKKTALARTRIEAMINRLKEMEVDT